MAAPQTASLRSSPELSLEEVVRSLSRECAFPVPVDVVTVRQTHISSVFLGGELVYKVKKPVKLPLFAAYRSAVRAKVAAILGGESEIPHPDRDEALARSRAHWLSH